MELREISREEHEMILNLFIMAFMDWSMPVSKNQYATFIDEWSLFNKLKDCFPMDEKHSDSYDANYIAWEIIYK